MDGAYPRPCLDWTPRPTLVVGVCSEHRRRLVPQHLRKLQPRVASVVKLAHTPPRP